MVIVPICGRRTLPRANQDRIIDQKTISNIINLLLKYDEIPVRNLALLYNHEYNEVLDATSMGIDGGLRSLLGKLSKSVELTERQGVLIASLCSDSTSTTSGNYSLESNEAQPSLRVELSAYELALKCNKVAVREHVEKIKKALAKHPGGLEVTKLSGYVPIDTKLLNAAPSINDTTIQLTEVFYRVERDSGEPLIFCGFTNTYKDLTGRDDRVYFGMDPQYIRMRALRTRMYEKTIMLIESSGREGLKLNVWAASLESNFQKHELDDELLACGIRFFFALARYNLLQIKSNQDCKNDLRAFVPENQVYESFKNDL